MNKPIRRDRFTQAAVLMTMALLFTAATPARSGTSVGESTVAVFDAWYRFDNRDFDDLGEVEAAVVAMHPARLDLLVCGPDSTRSLKAIVHRFHYLPLRLRLPDADDPACTGASPTVAPMRAARGPRPSGIDDRAVERYWQEIMP